MKSILLVGPPASGKSAYANKMMHEYSDPLKIRGAPAQKVGLYSFSKCTPRTNLIVVEDCGKDFPFWKYLNLIDKGIEVRRKGQDTFMVYPLIVFVATFDIYEIPLLGRSFLQRTFIHTF